MKYSLEFWSTYFDMICFGNDYILCDRCIKFALLLFIYVQIIPTFHSNANIVITTLSNIYDSYLQMLFSFINCAILRTPEFSSHFIIYEYRAYLIIRNYTPLRTSLSPSLFLSLSPPLYQIITV